MLDLGSVRHEDAIKNLTQRVFFNTPQLSRKDLKLLLKDEQMRQRRSPGSAPYYKWFALHNNPGTADSSKTVKSISQIEFLVRSSVGAIVRLEAVGRLMARGAIMVYLDNLEYIIVVDECRR